MLVTETKILNRIKRSKDNDTALLAIHDKLYEMKDQETVYAVIKAFKETNFNFYLKFARISKRSKHGDKQLFHRLIGTEASIDYSESLAGKYFDRTGSKEFLTHVDDTIKLAKHIFR